MNKDVIYIEPEQDITDILANIKASKHKIIALVPPKKAGVLRSAVNFKLIAKTARQNEKTVVLITTDESLRRLAGSVTMPVAKSLQSKPQLPESDDATEFGDEVDEKDDEKDDEPEEEAEPEKPAAAPAPNKKIPVATAVKVKKAPAAAKEDDVIEGEPEPESDDGKKPKTKSEKSVAKMKGTKVPNFAKYRKFIIAGGIALVVIILFVLWASLIAPAAKITVKVHAIDNNISEKVNFVSDESKADPKAGTFFLEEKTITKKAESDFKATGEVDKGTKATGKVTVVRPAGEKLSDSNLNFSIPKGATFTINGKEYVVSEGGSANITDLDKQAVNKCSRLSPCYEIKEGGLSSGGITVVAKENGDNYNIAAVSSSITSSLKIPSGYKVTSTAMTGGVSKKVKVVSKEDVENASSSLNMPNPDEINKELGQEFGDDYILFGGVKQSEAKITTSPALNEEVGDNVTPKIVKEVTYTMYAVQRESVKSFIVEKVTANLGDNTQEIYDTGIKTAFFDSFKNSENDNSAKLKTKDTKTGPRVTDEMVREKCLGYKKGECQSRLKSIKGVSSTNVDTSYFFVMTVPSDTNKVEVNIEVEQ